MVRSEPEGRPDPDLAVLAGLVGNIDRFAEEHWGRAPLLRRAGSPHPPLLTIERIEDLLVTGARRPTFRLVRDGTPLPPERSTRPVRLGGQVVDDAADLERIAVSLTEGATLVMQGLQRTDTEIAVLCRALERAVSHAVQANAYLTPAGASGLAPHRDDHDVIVVQLTGTKAWKIDGLGDVVLAEGDVLYLPAGTEHAATAQQSASLHLTIGLLTTSYADVVRRLAGTLTEAGLDRPLPLGYARPEHAATFEAELRAVLDATASAVKAADAAVMATVERDRARARRRPLLRGHLRAVLDLDDIGLATVLRRRADQPISRLGGQLDAGDGDADDDGSDGAGDGDGDGVVIVLPDRRITLPAIARKAVDALLSGGAVSVGDLPGIDEESRIVVARRLLREGVLELVTPR